MSVLQQIFRPRIFQVPEIPFLFCHEYATGMSTCTFAEILKLESEIQMIENALSRNEMTEMILTGDINNLTSQRQDMERAVESSRVALHFIQVHS